MRPDKRRPPRRQRRKFRFEPNGFSDPVHGPIWRWILTKLGIPREGRREAYNCVSLGMVAILVFGRAVLSLLTEGLGAGFSTLVGGLYFGWLAITFFRFFR